MQVLQNIFSKDLFYFHKTMPPVSTGLQSSLGMPFPLRSVVPSWNKNVTVTISFLVLCRAAPLYPTAAWLFMLSQHTMCAIARTQGNKSCGIASPHNAYPPLINRPGTKSTCTSPLPSSYSKSTCRVGTITRSHAVGRRNGLNQVIVC